MASVIRGDDNFDSGVLPEGRLANVWVNFNGTGVVAIRDEFNVSSITDNGLGDYDVNFTAVLDNTDYCVTSSSSFNGTNAAGWADHATPSTYAVGSLRVETFNDHATEADNAIVCITIHGGTS